MNVFHRLNNLIKYLCDEDFPSTIPNISKAMGVYEEQIKQDIEYLLNYESPKGNLFFAPHIKISLIDDEPCYNMDSKIFAIYDDPAKLHAFDYQPNPNHVKIFPMSLLEHELYNHAIRNDFQNCDFFSSYYDDFSFVASDYETSPLYQDADIILTIEEAICLGKSINIRYNSNKPHPMTPHFIKRDMDTGIFYVIQTFEEEDDILSIPIHEIDSCEMGADAQDNISTLSPKTMTYIDCLWSFSQDDIDLVIDEKPIHVKLKIFEDTPDIMYKIKKDTYCRNRATLEGPFLDSSDNKKTNIYYYEDDIIGMDTFKSWLKQFGSSIVVLEPKELAYDIYKELVLLS